MNTVAAVLTGDLIGSTQAGLAHVDGAMAAIQSVVLNEAKLSGADIRFARFRGDGGQIYSSDPTRVFRLAVLILAKLQSNPDFPKTRISAATGPAAFLPDSGLASARGEVFSISGQTLDGMTPQRLMFNTSEHACPGSWPCCPTLTGNRADGHPNRPRPSQSHSASAPQDHEALPIRLASADKPRSLG